MRNLVKVHGIRNVSAKQFDVLKQIMCSIKPQHVSSNLAHFQEASICQHKIQPYSTYTNTNLLLNAINEDLCTTKCAYSGGAIFLILKLFQISFRQRHFKKFRINTSIYIKPVITLIPYTFNSKRI